jgi:hypothetical protein
VSTYAPKNAAKIDGIPNRMMVALSACFPKSDSLKRLFRKCTIAVSIIAISIGKNNPKTGTNNVPNPKPENNVKPEPKKATLHIMIYSIF